MKLCYILPRTRVQHPILNSKLEGERYHEDRMDVFNKAFFVPTGTVITEDPMIIRKYKRDEVRVYTRSGWVKPRNETLNAPLEVILEVIMRLPRAVESAEGARAQEEAMRTRWSSLYAGTGG